MKVLLAVLSIPLAMCIAYAQNTSGKRYTPAFPSMNKVWHWPPGYGLCPDCARDPKAKCRVPKPITPADMIDAHRCLNGKLLVKRPCKTASVTYLCNPKTGLRIEMVMPFATDEEIRRNKERAIEEGAADWWPLYLPDPVYTVPHY